MNQTRTSWQDPLLHTELTWKPHAHSNTRSPRRGALVGMLHGVEVSGKTIGRGHAYQLCMLTGEVRTVWWDGTMGHDSGGAYYPYLYDVDTGEQVLRNPRYVAWFARLEDVK